MLSLASWAICLCNPKSRADPGRQALAQVYSAADAADETLLGLCDEGARPRHARPTQDRAAIEVVAVDEHAARHHPAAAKPALAVHRDYRRVPRAVPERCSDRS